MRIITANNKTTLRISKSDWQTIGVNAGWINSYAKNKKKSLLIKEQKENAYKYAEQIRKELRSRNHEVSKIKELTNNKIGILLVDGHRIDIEIKPWASQNNKLLVWRSGIAITIGSGLDKYFRRRRAPKDIEKICNDVEKRLDLYQKKENQRLKRQEVAEHKRDEKVEQIKLQRITV